MTLRHRDVRAVGDLLLRCYSAGDAWAQELLPGIAKLVPSTHSSFNLFDARRRRLTWIEHPPGLTWFPGAADAIAAHFHEHPVVRHFLREPADPAFVTISDFMTERQFARTAIYNEYYRKRGIRHQLSIMLPERAGPRIAIALNRDRRDFTDRERRILNLLPRHLVAAERNAASSHRVGAMFALVERGLDVAGIGLIVLRQSGRLELITAGASRLLDSYFGTRRARGLPEAVTHWLMRCYAPRADGTPPLPRPLLAARGERQLTICLRRDGDRRLLLLEERVETSPAERLAGLGLSSRQAEVLHWVARGKNDKEVALILGLSERTVHHHLEQVYRTLRVENRTAAARIALEAAESAAILPKEAGGTE